jgi:transposase-like protein
MSHYSAERKEVILKQLLPPHNRTVTEVSAHEGISTATLYNWRNKAKLEGVPVPGRSKSSEDWSGEAKLAVVVETIALSESELSEYCRQKGLYPEQVKTWKQDCLAGFESTPARKAQALKQSKSDRKQIRKLEKELRRKERALAETAALLVLRKKLNAFYAEDQEDD